jgi:hypothetical protein
MAAYAIAILSENLSEEIAMAISSILFLLIKLRMASKK